MKTQIIISAGVGIKVSPDEASRGGGIILGHSLTPSSMGGGVIISRIGGGGGIRQLGACAK